MSVGPVDTDKWAYPRLYIHVHVYTVDEKILSVKIFVKFYILYFRRAHQWKFALMLFIDENFSFV